MLIELRDVEVHIEPIEVLQQALQDYDLSITDAVNICIDASSVSEVLATIDNDDIEQYCINKKLSAHLLTLDDIATALPSLTHTDKAKLLWLLLKCEEV